LILIDNVSIIAYFLTSETFLGIHCGAY